MTSTTQPPNGVQAPANAEYQFPHEKLRRTPVAEGKTPLVLVACGSFSVRLYPSAFNLACRALSLTRPWQCSPLRIYT
jgi:hypothetical protein